MSSRLVGLGDLRVVELAGSPAGAYCAHLFALVGAQVTVISAPGEDAGGASSDHTWEQWLHHGTRRAVSHEPERAAAQLAPDVVIVSAAPGPLPPADPGVAWGRDVVRVELSPFGSTGPYAGWRSTDLSDAAISGHALLNGSPEREPLQGPPRQPAYAAGVFGFIGALAALWARPALGAGQRVEVAHHEVMAALHQFTLLRHTHNGDVLRRMGNRYAGPGQPIGWYDCLDGAVSLVVPRDDQLERLLAVTDLVHLLAGPGIGSTYDLMHHPTLLDTHLRPWLAARPVAEVVERLQEVRVPASPVNRPLDLLADRQLAARRYWHPARIPGTEDRGAGASHPPSETSVFLPGPPFRMTWRAEPGPAAPAAAPSPDLGDGPLTGVRVLDLTRVWAGPLAARILADLGADVIRVEAPWGRGPAGVDASSVLATRYYPDNDPGERHWNRIGFENKYGLNKRSVALDLTHPGARAALETLISGADMLIENYSPRVMPQLGLAEDRLQELNPALIYVTMPGYGRTGPDADRVAYGPMIDGHAGLSSLMGYEGSPGWKGGVAWPDPVAGIHAAGAALAALLARRADPGRRGPTVELSQLEAAVHMAGDAVVAAQIAGRDPEPMGNRHPCFAPQGVYPTAGHDRWLALSVTDDGAWAALCREAGLPLELATLDVAGRRARAAEIDGLLAAWTAPLDAADATARLQAAGVAAAPLADAADVLADPHLAARGFFVPVAHPEAGTHPWPRLPVVLSATPATIRRPAPLLGQHNHEVLTALAGLDETTLARLEAEGAAADRPPA